MRMREELDDMFANGMFQYLVKKYGAQNCENVKVKVFSIDDGLRWDDFGIKVFLSGSYSRGNGIAVGLYSDSEYARPLSPLASNFDAWSWQWYLAEKDAKGEMGDFTLRTDPGKRQEIARRFFDSFDDTLANVVPQYDVLIFLNRERLTDLELTLPDPCASQKVMTHECVNLIEERTGEQLVKNHDPTKFLDRTSQECFDEYVRMVGGMNKFKQRYLP